MERYHHAIKFGKPSISIYFDYRHLYHGELLVLTRGYHFLLARFDLPTSSLSTDFLKIFISQQKSPVIARFMICFAIEVPFQAVSPKYLNTGHPKIYHMNSDVYAMYICMYTHITTCSIYYIYTYIPMAFSESCKPQNPRLRKSRSCFQNC